MAQNFVACDREQELLLPPSLREWFAGGPPGVAGVGGGRRAGSERVLSRLSRRRARPREHVTGAVLSRSCGGPRVARRGRQPEKPWRVAIPWPARACGSVPSGRGRPTRRLPAPTVGRPCRAPDVRWATGCLWPSWTPGVPDRKPRAGQTTTSLWYVVQGLLRRVCVASVAARGLECPTRRSSV
jgi:hypothetical protein